MFGVTSHSYLENKVYIFINKFYEPGIFLSPLKSSTNLRFFDIFIGYRKRLVANGLCTVIFNVFSRNADIHKS